MSTIESELAKFYAVIEQKRKRLGISSDPAWYRGHSHSTYELAPSLFRIPDIRLIDEKNIFTTFLTEGRAHIPDNADPWSVLAIMQHYRVPTRLLDWTDSLHVALFFALKYKEHDCPHIWILNPYRLNGKYKESHRVIYGEAEKIDIDYYACLQANSWPYEFPIAIAPSWVSPRLAAQRGYFTIHGSSSLPMEKTVKGCIERVDLPKVLYERLLYELHFSGTDEGRMFPDLDGLAMSIRRRLGIKNN